MYTKKYEANIHGMRVLKMSFDYLWMYITLD